MKISSKIKSILLSMLCIAALTSCGNKQEDVPAVTSGETSGTVAADISGETAADTSETTSPTETTEEETTSPVTEIEPVVTTAFNVVWIDNNNAVVDTAEETLTNTASSDEYPHLIPLTDETRVTLLADYAKFIKWRDGITAYDVRVVYYYGTYDSGEVVVMYGYDAATDDVNYFSAGGYDFYLPSGSYEVTLHTGLEFIPLDEAYQSGYLSDSDMEEIHYHAENSEVIQPYLKLKKPVLEPLTRETEKKIKEDYAVYYARQRGRDQPGPGTSAGNMTVVEYYGTYDSGEVAVVYKKGIHDDGGNDFIVGGYAFSLPSGDMDITLHINSTFILLKEAYGSGYLSDKDMMEIHYFWMTYPPDHVRPYPIDLLHHI